MRRFGKIIAAEAQAYLRSGLLVPGGRECIVDRSKKKPRLGAFFIPGFGANPSQFMALKQALEGEVEWFDGFEYSAFRSPHDVAEELSARVQEASWVCPKIMLIGHSFGGVIARMVVQAKQTPAAIKGFVAICAPLHGTSIGRFAVAPSLRSLAPDSALIADLCATKHRLTALDGAVLTIGTRYDSFINPYDSAFIDGSEKLCLDDAGHVSSLFDERTHRAVGALARKLKAE